MKLRFSTLRLVRHYRWKRGNDETYLSALTSLVIDTGREPPLLRQRIQDVSLGVPIKICTATRKYRGVIIEINRSDETASAFDYILLQDATKHLFTALVTTSDAAFLDWDAEGRINEPRDISLIIDLGDWQLRQASTSIASMIQAADSGLETFMPRWLNRFIYDFNAPIENQDAAHVLLDAQASSRPVDHGLQFRAFLLQCDITTPLTPAQEEAIIGMITKESFAVKVRDF